MLAALAGCGSSKPPPAASPEPAPSAPAPSSASGAGKSTPTDAPETEAAPPPAAEGGLPTTCRKIDEGSCVLPNAFVDRLCDKPHQGVALALFSPSTPFTRAYLRGKLDELAFDEEVLVLRYHAQQKGGMIVGSGKGTYDLLRWDGSCAMGVEAEVLTHSRPPHPRTAHIPWHRIESRTQDALLASSDAVKRAHARRGKECKGAMSGDVSAACEKADDALGSAVADYVRSGGALPPPTDVP